MHIGTSPDLSTIMAGLLCYISDLPQMMEDGNLMNDLSKASQVSSVHLGMCSRFD